MDTSCSVIVCSLCDVRSTSLSLWISHLRQVHSNDDGISLSCPLPNCSASYRNVNSFCSHIYRKHRGPFQGSSVESLLHSNILLAPSQIVSDSVSASATWNDTDLPELQELTQSGNNSPPCYSDIDHCLEKKKKNCLFLMKLKEERMLSQIAINDVVLGCQDLISNALSSVRDKLTELSLPPNTESEIFNVMTEVSDPFAELKTSYLQDKFISEEMGCIVSP